MLGVSPWVDVDDADLPGVDQGAVVVPPGGGGRGVVDAHGALVGWFGPLGTDTGVRDGTRDEAQGAAVPLADDMPPPAAHGARVPGSANGSRNEG